jgi:hypothetical protein
MYFILGGLITLIAVVTIRRVLVSGTSEAQYGYVSEQWLAEYRASHPSNPY